MALMSRKIRPSLSAWQIYADAFMLLFAWAMMLVFSMVLMLHVQSKKNDDYHPKAEFLVTLTWDDARDVDLDLWLRPPDNPDKPVFYQNRETQNISLDRDSRGYITNRKQLEEGKVAVSANREIIAIRAIMPGDYIVGVSYYDGVDLVDHIHYPTGTPVDAAKIQARIQVDKVNPSVTSVFDKTVNFTFVKEVQAICAFHIADDGKITMLDKPTDPFLPEGLTGSTERTMIPR